MLVNVNKKQEEKEHKNEEENLSHYIPVRIFPHKATSTITTFEASVT